MNAKRPRRNEVQEPDAWATPAAEAVVESRHEGDDTSSGVNYSYTVCTSALAGRYECRIHKYLVASGIHEFLSADFLLAGRKWRIKIARTEGGRYSLFLLLKSELSAIVHYSFILENHKDEQRNRMKAWRAAFESASQWGYRNFFSVDDVRDRDSGYLLGDSIVVVIRLRQCTVETESLSVVPMQNAFTYTWSLRHVNGLGPAALKSDDTRHGPAAWSLKLEPYKVTEDSDRCGVFLCCYAQRPVVARCKITLLNHRDIRRRVEYNAFTRTFPIGYSFWGWPNFIDANVLKSSESGFVDDEGWTTLIAHIWLLGAEERLRQQRTGVTTEGRPSISQDEDDGLCVVCMEKKQTCGFVHGKTSHKCVCAKCCELLYRTTKRCPVCNANIDSIITGYF